MEFVGSSSSSSVSKKAKGKGKRKAINEEEEEEEVCYCYHCSSRVDVSLSLSLGPSNPSRRQGVHPDHNNSGGALPRFCHSCGATETPLWRKGPMGTKTLCNACGLRYWKEERIVSSKLTLGQPTPKQSNNGDDFRVLQ